jgi:cystathionine beta-lyase
VSPPVDRGSTILFDDVDELRAARPGLGQYYYGLHGWPTQWALAEALTELEPGAAGTALVETGLAAVTAALTAVLSAGDELLMVDSVYGPTRRFCDETLSRFGVTTRYYDPLLGADQLEELVCDRTKAIFLESPGSHTFEVQDVPGIAAMARRRGVATILDNTWATPLLFPAIEHGVDISVQALSKYVGGHSDLLLGSITANAEWYDRVQETVWQFGHAAAPDDAWLSSRGLWTLSVWLKRHE